MAVHDRQCQRYVDDPNYEWYGNRWRKLEEIERNKATAFERNTRNNPKRLRTSGMYLGMAGFTPHQKEMINGSS